MFSRYIDSRGGHMQTSVAWGFIKTAQGEMRIVMPTLKRFSNLLHYLVSVDTHLRSEPVILNEVFLDDRGPFTVFWFHWQRQSRCAKDQPYSHSQLCFRWRTVTVCTYGTERQCQGLWFNFQYIYKHWIFIQFIKTRKEPSRAQELTCPAKMSQSNGATIAVCQLCKCNISGRLPDFSI
jgi:hypothetical protein